MSKNLAMQIDKRRRRFLGHAASLAALATLTPAPSFAAGESSAFEDPDDAGYIDVPGGRVWYRLNGRKQFSRGRAPLVALHGGPGASHHYLLPLTRLADERPVILYDQLDSGNSDRPGLKSNWTVERFVDEIDAVRNALGLDRVILLGSSCGATWCGAYAARRPSGLLGCVLGSPFLSARRWVADATRLRAALPDDVRAVLEAHEAAGTTDSEAYHDADQVWVQRHVCRLDPMPVFVQRAFELFNAELYGYMWGPSESMPTGLLKDYEAEASLERIQAPVLYTCGEFDEATPESTRAFAAATPGAEVAVFPGASHMPHAETPALYASALRRWLAKVDA